MLIIYIKYSKDKVNQFIFKIIMLSIAHYLPIIDLLKEKNINLEKILNLEIILLNLILINLYFTYLNYRDLDVNKLYYDYYLDNKLI
tara:strand:- start:617 stop:877 length:261 start_codon:yes stop_codon:yes gene_type:complete